MANMEQIEMFIAFMELVRNPAKYDVMLKEMKEQTVELTRAVEAYTNVQSANKYFNKLKEEHAEKVTRLQSDQKEFSDYKSKQMDELKQLSVELDAKRLKIEKFRLEADASYKQFEIIRTIAEQIQEEVAKQKQNLVSYEAQLTERETRLKAREDKIKQLLG